MYFSNLVTFIKTELKYLYKRFNHPNIKKLWFLLKQVNRKVDYKILKLINKFYHHYQIKKQAPQRFKFVLKNNINFNYKIIINIIYLNN